MLAKKILEKIASAGTVALMGYEVGVHTDNHKNNEENNNTNNNNSVLYIFIVLIICMMVLILAKLFIKKRQII